VMCHFGSITSGLKVIRVTSTIGIASWAPVWGLPEYDEESAEEKTFLVALGGQQTHLMFDAEGTVKLKGKGTSWYMS
jgi:hypothetical protein